MLTRVQYDFDVSVPKISTPRFSTTLISVEYLLTVKIHRPGHHPLNFQACRQIKAKTPFAPVFYDISKSKMHSKFYPIFQKVLEFTAGIDIYRDGCK